MKKAWLLLACCVWSVAVGADPEKINIRAPNREGVSRNKFDQFNVGANGVILNNSKSGTDTKLGGTIDGNPALKRGEASVIVNEVTGTMPSRLEGMIEVAGRKANVIIANPSGIICSGCGFINAQHSTLTTGQVMMENGRIKGFDVDRGDITFTGDGLNNRSTRYTDVMARAIRINAGLKASQLRLVTGRNTVEIPSADQLVPTPKTSGDGGTSPRFALDVTALGGMYASKISLIGTENGVGVRNAGELSALAGGISLRADGRIHNMTTIKGQEFVTLTSRGEVDNKGKIFSNDGYVTITSNGWRNTGKVTSKGPMSITSRSDMVNEGSVLATENIVMNTPKNLTNSGTIQSKSGTISLSVNGRIENTRTMSSKRHLSLVARSVDNQKLINGDEALSITGKSQIKNKDTLQSGGHVTLTAGNLHNSGVIKSQGYMSIVGRGHVTNDGQLISQRNLKIVAEHGVINIGTISADEHLTLSTKAKDISRKNKGAARPKSPKADVSNLDGRIATKGNISISTGGGSLINTCTKNKDCGIYSNSNITVLLEKGNIKSKKGTLTAGKRITVH